MRKVERVITSIIGLAFAILPIILRLYIFREDVGAFDSEFWGAMVVMGFFIGIAFMWSGISGQSLTESEEE